MVFSSLQFIFIFLPAMMVVYYLLPFKARNGWLFLASMVFYGYGALEQPLYILLLLVSILVNYTAGRLMGKYPGKAKVFLICGTVYNLGWLFLFKYADFFASNLNRLFGAVFPEGNVSIPLTHLILPIGISFYTFQIISYLADVYRGTAEVETSPIRLGAYITMFPQLIAGPIVRYSSIAAELKERECSWKRLDNGLKTFTLGLGLKVILANQLGNLWNDTNSIGFESISTPMAWMGIIAFSLQLYFDFWGYSMMAIGLGDMLGFHIPINFDHPYTAKSMTEFWRRWHITLGEWFRNYVYIPLGGNRKGKYRTVCNLLVVWLLTGFWHGADWNFLLWGLVLFLLISIEKLGLKKYLDKYPVVGHLYMILIIPLSWLIFAVTDVGQIGVYLTRLFPFFGEGSYVFAGDFMKNGISSFILLGAGLILSTPFPFRLYERYKDKAVTGILLLAVFWGAVYCLYIGLNDPFLYFRF